ncbi:hypothetical protein BTVI_155868 [Pitangus sulphuratus]|nr:hypothetical protein BTVI_155868 [Pitangus sulphuratus]
MELGKGLEHKSDEEQLKELGVVILGKKRLRSHFITLCNCLKEGRNKVGVSLFSWATSDRTIGNGLKLCQGRFRMDIRKNSFTETIVKHWNRLPRELVESSFLDAFKKRVDMALNALV